MVTYPVRTCTRKLYTSVIEKWPWCGTMMEGGGGLLDATAWWWWIEFGSALWPL